MESREAGAQLVGRLLYAAMKEAGISQKELANRTGISHSNISEYVNSRHCCSIPTLIELLAGCDLEITELRCSKSTTSSCVILKNS